MSDDPGTLRALLMRAIDSRLDGNVGCVLSGGIDSSSVVIMARQVHAHLPTFTGWYDEPGFDERKYARLVGGRPHTEVQITPQDFLNHFDGMLEWLRPPLQGPGAFGQYMVARAAAQHGCDVLLSGEGADELFGGYARLLMVAKRPLPDGYDGYQLPDDYPDTIEDALEYDLERLPDLLAVDDQMCAAWGIEARAPFTDLALMEYVLDMPAQTRIGKFLLRRAMRGYVPAAIIDRRDKMGFPVPFVKWAQGPLRDFVGDRIGYIPDPELPYDRQWWIDMCGGVRA